jgi:hypothetical protein
LDSWPTARLAKRQFFALWAVECQLRAGCGIAIPVSVIDDGIPVQAEKEDQS